jgi:hypothetical protein
MRAGQNFAHSLRVSWFICRFPVQVQVVHQGIDATVNLRILEGEPSGCRHQSYAIIVISCVQYQIRHKTDVALLNG